MTDQEIIAAFESAGALLTGHFQLRSKKHSNRFFQAALVFKKPWVGEELCKELAARIKAAGIEAETVISLAVGGLFVGRRSPAPSTSNPSSPTRRTTSSS